MNLLQKTAFTWLEPATPAERRTLARLEEIERILAEEPAAETEQAAGTAEIDQRGALEAEAAKIRKGMAKAAQWRITVTTASVLAMAKREAYMQDAYTFYREMFPPRDEGDDTEPTMAENIQRNFVWTTLRIWATARALTAGIEERQISRLDLDSDDGWKEIGRPEWLDSPGAFLEQIPDTLAGAWDRFMQEVNPGLMEEGEPDDQKKRYGGASATK